MRLLGAKASQKERRQEAVSVQRLLTQYIPLLTRVFVYYAAAPGVNSSTSPGSSAVAGYSSLSTTFPSVPPRSALGDAASDAQLGQFPSIVSYGTILHVFRDLFVQASEELLSLECPTNLPHLISSLSFSLILLLSPPLLTAYLSHFLFYVLPPSWYATHPSFVTV